LLLEAVSFDVDAIHADGKIEDLIIAVLVGSSLLGYLRGDIGDGDAGAGNWGAAGISHVANDAARGVLGEASRGDESRQDCKNREKIDVARCSTHEIPPEEMLKKRLESEFAFEG